MRQMNVRSDLTTCLKTNRMTYTFKRQNYPSLALLPPFFIFLQCLSQVVKVHIKGAAVPPVLSVSSPHSSPCSVSTVSAWSSRETTLSGTGPSLQLASANVHFEQAQVGKQHGEYSDDQNVTNISPHKI